MAPRNRVHPQSEPSLTRPLNHSDHLPTRRWGVCALWEVDLIPPIHFWQGTQKTLNDFLPNQRESFYASRSLTSADLENIKNAKYGNGDELFVAKLKYIAAAN